MLIDGYDFAPLGVGIIWLVTVYLMVLGLVVLAKPLRAREFMAGFAQTTVANLLESGLRAVVGVAFVIASSETKAPLVSVVIGLFLAISALLMILLPGMHQKFAQWSTAKVFAIFPLFGAASLILAVSVAWFVG